MVAVAMETEKSDEKPKVLKIERNFTKKLFKTCRTYFEANNLQKRLLPWKWRKA